MSRVLFVQEHVRTDHAINHNDGTVTVSFLDASSGRKLLEQTNKHGITRRDIDVAYVYPKVPEAARVSSGGNIISYKEVALGKASEYHGQLIDKIVESKPEVVVPNGRLGCKFLIDEVSIMRNRGIPVKKTITNEAGESHTFWVLPIYSMEFLALRPSVGRQVEMDMELLKKYLDEGESAFTPSEVEYDYVGTFEGVKGVFEHLKMNKPTTSWDLETNTLKPEMDGAKALVISLSWEEQTGVTIPLEHKEFEWGEGELEKILTMIREFVADEEIPKVGANIAFDIRFLMSVYGFKHFRNNMDVQVGYWMTVSQERDGSRRLSNLAYEFTDMGGYDEELENWVKKYKKDYRAEHKKKPVNEIDGSDFNYEWIPYDMLIEYAAGDADVTLRVHNKILERVNTNPKWIEMYTNFYPRMSAAIAQMESNGLHLDLEYAKETAIAYREEEERLVQEMRKLPSVKIVEDEYREFYEIGLKEWEKKPADRDKELAKWRNKYKNKLEFNPRSGADKGKVLFDVLDVKLPFEKDYIKDSALRDKNPRTMDDLSWEDISTNKAVLEEISEGNHSEEAKTLADLMIEYSSVATLRSTFAEKAEEDMADDGAIHGNFNINGTSTSRLSSSGPNLQNIVATHNNVHKFDYHHPIKRMYVSRFEDGVILEADYSALEMRILGLVAGDPEMTQTFMEDGDIHKNTASIINHKPEEEVTYDEREASKAVSFGIIYGKGVPGLAGDLGVSVPEAQAVYDQFMRTKPSVAAYIENVHNFIKQHGYVETLQGHRRNLQDVFGNRTAEAGALRQSVNTIVQGTGAYLTNLSVAMLHEYILDNNKRTRLVATVHDSIVLDIPEDEIEEMIQITQIIMENLPIDFLTVDLGRGPERYPIASDVEIGLNYSDLVPFDIEDYRTFNSAEGYIKFYRDIHEIVANKDSKIIPAEQADMLIKTIEESKPAYQRI